MTGDDRETMLQDPLTSDFPSPDRESSSPERSAAPFEREPDRSMLPVWFSRLRELFSLRPVRAGLAAGALIILAAGLTLALGGRGIRLSESRPALPVDDLLSVELADGGTARVRVEVIPLEDALGDDPLPTWQAARDALPAYLEPASPLYRISARGDVRLVIRAEGEAADARMLDLYRWDAEAGEWVFVPVSMGEDGSFRAESVDGPVALFRTGAAAPLIGTVLEEGQPLNGMQAALLNTLFVAGTEGQADGSLEIGDLALESLPPGSYAVLPVVRYPDRKALSRMLNSRAARQRHIEGLVALTEREGIAGLAIDYGEVDPEDGEAFHRLVEELAGELADEKLLAIRLPTPEGSGQGRDTSPYDWQRLGRVADILIVTPPANPGDYIPGGPADEFLTWASGQISRRRLYVAFSSLSVDEWAGRQYPITFEYALAPLGHADLSPESGGPPFSPEAGVPLTFELRGEALDPGQDSRSGAYRYRVYSGDGEHRVWLVTGADLRRRLDLVAAHGVGGIVIEDLLAEGNSADILTAVSEFKGGLPSSLDEALRLRWTVRDASGTVLAEETTALNAPLEWTPEEEGEFVISVELIGAGTSSGRGDVAIIVGGEGVGIVPTQESVVAGAPDIPTDAPAPTYAAIPEGMPPPVVPPSAPGNFELGGQVNHVINHPEYMRQAGMTWVKFQLAWAPDMDASVAWDLISRGRAEGFKVLLSIPGQVKYPTDIDVETYLEFLRGVAYYGPDAIEVWNEANLDFEWPRGQIDGGRYVREMLAPAYNAIKEVNPNIMVISGAPAPTGAYYAEGGCSLQGYGCDDWLFLQQMAEAGGANYMDCVGAHYNSGATSPTVMTGHPADPGYQHYSWYFNGMLQLYGGTFGRPVCFTELGYLSGEGYGSVPDRFSWAASTTVAQQARWLAEAATLARESGLVRLMIVWNVDFTYWGDDPMAGYAIVRPDGSCPACVTLGNVMP
ncbi:MAG TPA: hypothetical protein ENI95_05805 [Chloroflexi bacterium]|nr:hypothetical protein [Chloroflexota bacterium]